MSDCRLRHGPSMGGLARSRARKGKYGRALGVARGNSRGPWGSGGKSEGACVAAAGSSRPTRSRRIRSCTKVFTRIRFARGAAARSCAAEQGRAEPLLLAPTAARSDRSATGARLATRRSSATLPGRVTRPPACSDPAPDPASGTYGGASLVGHGEPPRPRLCRPQASATR